jgi:hypothetical protein
MDYLLGKSLISNHHGTCQFPTLDASEAVNDLTSQQKDLKTLQEIYQKQINHLEASLQLKKDAKALEKPLSQESTQLESSLAEAKSRLNSTKEEIKAIESTLPSIGLIAEKTAELKGLLTESRIKISDNKINLQNIEELEKLEETIEHQKQIKDCYQIRLSFDYCESCLCRYLRPLLGLGYILSFFARKRFEKETEQYKKSLQELEASVKAHIELKNEKRSLLPSDQPIDQFKQKLLDENAELETSCRAYQKEIEALQSSLEKDEAIINIQTARKLYTLVKDDSSLIIGKHQTYLSAELNSVDPKKNRDLFKKKRDFFVNHTLKACSEDKMLTSLKASTDILRQAKEDALEGNLNTAAVKTTVLWERILQSLKEFDPHHKLSNLDRFHLISMLHFANLAYPSESVMQECAQKGLICAAGPSRKAYPLIEVKKTFFKDQPVIRTLLYVSKPEGSSKWHQVEVNLAQKTYAIKRTILI